MGPALAPPIGGTYLAEPLNLKALTLVPFSGFVAHYASWRFMQIGLGAFAFLAFVVIFLVFPETSHPGTRGIDKLRLTGEVKHSWRYVNPLRPLYLMRSPTIVGVVRFRTIRSAQDFITLQIVHRWGSAIIDRFR
jgi:hypothetical protein